MATRQEVAKELNAVSGQLRDLYWELATVEKSAHNARQNTYENTSAGTITEIRYEMDLAERDYRQEIIDLKADILAAEERRDHLRFMLKYGLEGEVRVEVR